MVNGASGVVLTHFGGPEGEPEGKEEGDTEGELRRVDRHQMGLTLIASLGDEGGRVTPVTGGSK